MKRSLLVLAALCGSAASAASAQISAPFNRPLQFPLQHVPTPPPMPINRFKPQNLRASQNRGVVFVPSYLYGVAPYPYGYYDTPDVSVTNVNVYPQYSQGGPEYTIAPPPGLVFWNPETDPAPDARAANSPPPAAVPADVSSLDAIVNAYYNVLSGPPIKGRDWSRFRSLFADGAHMIATVAAPGMPATSMVMTSDQYATNAAPLIQRGFYEKEIFRSTEQFGHMAQVFSTYESRYHDTDVTPFQRGINSIQLMNDGTRWWIVSFYWDAERPDNPIPAKFLPAVKK